MKKTEAKQLLAEHLAQYRQRSYADLLQLVGEPIVDEATGPSGARYQIETEIFRDDRQGGALRVLAGIDDGGWRAFVPLSDGFIMAPDGSFVGE